jgi:hypothetical protein
MSIFIVNNASSTSIVSFELSMTVENPMVYPGTKLHELRDDRLKY